MEQKEKNSAKFSERYLLLLKNKPETRE